MDESSRQAKEALPTRQREGNITQTPAAPNTPEEQPNPTIDGGGNYPLSPRPTEEISLMHHNRSQLSTSSATQIMGESSIIQPFPEMNIYTSEDKKK